MIAIISSIIISISVLVATLITFTPNARVITESDFIRNATNNAYLYGWELAQLDVRTNSIADGGASNVAALGYASEKNGAAQLSLKATIAYKSANANPLTIQVDKQ